MDDSPQKPDRSEGRRALGGLLILAVIGALAVLIISLDELFAARTPTVSIHAALPESGGLVAGAPVWIAGLEVGEVIAVRLLPPERLGVSRVVAVARIPREHLGLLRQDSRATLASARLMGDPVLDFSPGSRGAPPLNPRDTVLAEHSPRRAAAAIASARRLVAEIDTLAVQLARVGTLYRARRPMIDEVTRSVDLAAAELDRTAVAFEQGPLATTLRDARLAERFAEVRNALGTVRAGLGRYTTGPLGQRLAALEARTDSVRADVALLDSLTSDPNAGFIGRFRADSALAVETGRTSAQMDSLVEEVMSNPFMFF